MAGPALKLRATSPDGTSADIETICRTITWSGDWRSAARTLRYTPAVCQDDVHLPRAPTELGGSVQFWANGTLLMDAFALERTRDSLGRTIDVTAYDRGLYLTRNSAFLRVERQTAEAVTASLCRQFGIKTGTLTATGVPVTRNFLGVPLYKIVMTMYSLAADQTKKKYHPFDKAGVTACLESVDITLSNTLKAKKKAWSGLYRPQLRTLKSSTPKSL